MTAGGLISLTCSATVDEYLQGTPSVRWQLPGNIGTSQGEQITTGTVSMRTLTLSPLRTSHGGLYVCEATVSIAGITPVSQNATEEVFVQSKLLGKEVILNLLLILPQFQCLGCQSVPIPLHTMAQTLI